MPFSGSQQLRAVSRDLKVAGSPAKGIQSKMRRNILLAMTPMKQEVQRNAFNIPTKGQGSTGLRVALMRATGIRISSGLRNVLVRLIVDGKRMPKGQESLPGYMEGEKRWRHPVFGDAEVWVPQQSHPFVAPAIPRTILAAERGVKAAVDVTAAQLTKGLP